MIKIKSRTWWGVFFVLFLAASGYFISYRANIVLGPQVQGEIHLPVKEKTGVKLHVFNTGFNKMSYLLAPGAPPWRPAPAFVIEHPTKGLIVFDTGLSSEVEKRGEKSYPIPMRWLFKSRGQVGRTLHEQMIKDGLNPLTVGEVILSHFHEDHIGDVNSFSSSQVWVGGSDCQKHLQGVSAQQIHVLSSLNYKISLFEFGYDLFGDNTIILLRGGGHTNEDIMVLVQLDRGPVLLAGDAVVHWNWLRSDDVERIPVNPDRAAEIRNKIRTLVDQQPDVIVFPGHDLSQLPNNRKDIVLHNEELFKPEAWPSVFD